MDSEEFPKLILLDWQEGDDWLIRSKGWFCHNHVELINGDRYQVCFYDKAAIIEAEKQGFFESIKSVQL